MKLKSLMFVDQVFHDRSEAGEMNPATLFIQ
jgi:hypothetical protein